ncbi:hypothetical protein Ancab_032395 [Ancistrocladus abbreviatus]
MEVVLSLEFPELRRSSMSCLASCPLDTRGLNNRKECIRSRSTICINFMDTFTQSIIHQYHYAVVLPGLQRKYSNKSEIKRTISLLFESLMQKTLKEEDEKEEGKVRGLKWILNLFPRKWRRDGEDDVAESPFFKQELPIVV